VILITTAYNDLSGTIPTEIGQLTKLKDLWLLHLGKYDGCLRCFHVLFFVYELTYLFIFSPLIALHSPTIPLSLSPYFPYFVILNTTDATQLSGTIPTEIGQLTELTYLDLGKYEKCLRCFHAPIVAALSSHMKTVFSPFGQFTNDTIVIHRHIVHFL
jgi:hypothetical protein